MGRVLEFVFGQVLLREVAEGGVGVFGSVVIFPGAVGLVVLLAQDALELVFAYFSRCLHWICEARLSRRRELASELCCSLGSIQ